MVIHLRTHSCYSFLEGLASPAELAQAAARLGMPALGLTDHIGMTGAVEFYDACREAGLQPILGLELEAALPGLGSGSLALLACDLAGWGNLCRLSSALLAGPPTESPPPLTLETLAAHSRGLLCLSGGLAGLAAQLLRLSRKGEAAAALRQLAEIFAGCLYVELQQTGPQDIPLVAGLAELADSLHLPIAASHPVYYLSPEEAGLQKLAAAIRLIRPLKDLPVEACAPVGAYFTAPEEMARRFSDYPAALAATEEIAERCALELPVGVPHYPDMPLPEGQSAAETLRQRAEQGARGLYPSLTPEIQARLDHELAVINASGYAPLFLIMQEILDHARKIGVPTSSRGSAASSLVAHCLGITSPDPMRLNLYFERFLNPARHTPPDIDTDLCSRRRDEVIRFVYEHFGAERVAMVCTINRFRRRSALRETAKAYGLPPEEVSVLADSLPHRGWGPPGRYNDQGAPFAELAERYTSPRHQAIFRDAAALLGKPHHLSIHPGGVVITPGPLNDLVPTEMATKGVVITQFDLESVERLGLVKIDLLGIRGLTVLGDVAEAIGAQPAPGVRHSGGVHPILDVLEAIPEDDPATRQTVQNGRTIGCFQIESPGMRATLKEIQAQSVDDLMVALALYRPGPLTGGLKDAFVRRHRGLEPTSQLHPALTPLLEDTYGVILYQEQVLRIAHELGGFSLAEADLLRRAMSHFDPGKQMQTLKEKFIAAAQQRSGVPPDVAERVWELMAAFAGYGFPKAHAASYAQIGWRAAWCKTHYPALFMAAVLANWGGYYGQRVYLTEARRMHLALGPPHINYARHEFSVTSLEGKPVLFMGLDQVKELTRRTQRRILEERPFTSLSDFLVRADPRPIEAESLVRVGALEGLGTIPGLLRQLKGERRRGGQLSLFPLEEARTEEEDWTLAEKVAAQEAVLGASVAAHPLELVSDQIAAAQALNTVEAAARLGQTVRVAGMRQTWRRTRTTRGEFIYFMSLEDLEGMLDVVITADVYRRNREALSGPGPYVLEGTVELNQEIGEPFIRAARFSTL
jgi:DNA polymerase-3 subunit alpha